MPEDGKDYPLPPGLGRLPLVPARDAAGAVPDAWRKAGDVLVPMYQREALWLSFGGAAWKPNAVQVAAGAVDAVSGEPWPAALSRDPQNYVVAPDQPWLDGFNAGQGTVRQFVAMPLGAGRTVEAQLAQHEREGGIQLRVYEPLPGRFPDEAPPPAPVPGRLRAGAPGAMGLGAGGSVRQRIYPDPYGVDAWDPENCATVTIRILNSEQWHATTGRPAPPTPVDTEAYARHELPWFELYDEERGDVAPAERLGGLEGTADAPEAPVEIAEDRIRGIDRES